MPMIYGRDSLHAANVPLVQLYVLRRTRSNTVLLKDLDEYLRDRPDWIVYRLLRERQPRALLKVPAEVPGGAALLLQYLKKASDSSSEHVRWTVYGLVSLWLLRLMQVERSLWYVRMSSRLSDVAIPEGDRVDNETLEKILRWLQLRNEKFSSGLAPSLQQPLVTLRRRPRSREQVQEAERAILVALGQISYYLAAKELRLADAPSTAQTLAEIQKHLSLAMGRWRPGWVVFLDRLQHYQPGFGPNVFNSCLLPITTVEYHDWLAAALGRFASAAAGDVDDLTRLFLHLTSIQHRERSVARAADPASLNQALDSLLVAIDYTLPIAMDAKRPALAAGLASRFLQIGNVRGWSNVPVRRLYRARGMKSLARIFGCTVEGEAAELDFSKMHEGFKPSDYVLDENAEEYRRLLRQGTSRTDTGAAQNSSGLTVPSDAAVLVKIARKVRVRYRALNSYNDKFWVLRGLIDRIRRGDPADIESLLNTNHELFEFFSEAYLVGGIAQLTDALIQHDRIVDSALSHGRNVVRFAVLLLYFLERPYMADVQLRAHWQRLLWQAYLYLNENEKKLLSRDDRLLIYAAVSHVTAATLRALGESQGDSLENTIYKDAPSTSDFSVAMANEHIDLRIDVERVWRILKSYESRGQSSTALVQIAVSPDGKAAMLLLITRFGEDSRVREITVDFDENEHQGLVYSSWSDVSAEVTGHDYFNNETGELIDFNLSPLGQQPVRKLWEAIESGLARMGFVGLPEHLWIIPDATLANVPWQLVARSLSRTSSFPVINLAHGLLWIHTAVPTHEGDTRRDTERRFHTRGVNVWISNSPTPRPGLDMREYVKQALFGADNDMPSLTDVRGVSLSVVFGHGHIKEGQVLAATEAIEDPNEWDDVRECRVCVLLSCYTGAGKPGALGDYLSISHKLSRNSKALILPSVEVSHLAVKALVDVIHTAFSEYLETGRSWRVQNIYREALMRDPGVALMSLWGFGYEPLIWRASSNAAPKDEGARTALAQPSDR